MIIAASVSPDSLKSGPNLKISKLANGVNLILEQMPVEAVTISIWLNVGAAIESEQLAGIAHFLEHMIFKGSARQAPGEFEAAIEACGGSTNACTSNDYTNYHITIAPADFAELAPRLLDLVLNAAIPDQEFERERLVVLEEIRRSQDNCDRRIYRELAQLIYADLPYSRPVLGSEQVIGRLNPSQMQKFHRDFYQPHNITIAVVGRLPVDQMQAVIERFWHQDYLPYPNIAPSPPALSPAMTLAHPEIRKEIIDPQLKRARLTMSWRTPKLADYASHLALGVLASILGGGRTSRLIKDLKETRGLCDRLSVGISSQKLAGSFQVSMQLSVENLAIAEQAVCEHIQKVGEELVEIWELEKIGTQVAKRFIFANESPKQRAHNYGYYDCIVENLEMTLDYPQQIALITSTQIQQMAQEFLKISNMQVLIALPHQN